MAGKKKKSISPLEDKGFVCFLLESLQSAFHQRFSPISASARTNILEPGLIRSEDYFLR